MALQTLQDQICIAKTQEIHLLMDQNVALILELQKQHSEKEMFRGQEEDLNAQLQEFLQINSHLLEQFKALDGLKIKTLGRTEGHNKSTSTWDEMENTVITYQEAGACIGKQSRMMT
ncbi:GRIP1-associated protein 1 [Chelonia mydas]|uniref:GRIP1-associated protein 1 n=1 Tax=Chelonia mydas TaxID=8469 RepID=M7BB07_CHEMY|nr:GRIP1-associated protein 1 [Chelonia mydas]